MIGCSSFSNWLNCAVGIRPDRPPASRSIAVAFVVRARTFIAFSILFAVTVR